VSLTPKGVSALTFIIVTLIWIISVYLSGWQIHRCMNLTYIFIWYTVSSFLFTIIAYGIMHGDFKDTFSND
jgi:hypothetical protein